MKVTPWILGAAVAVPMIGAFAGTALGTEPIGTAQDVTASLPDHMQLAKGSAAPATQPRLPDHYDMKTPDGTVEVHELAARGRDYEGWQDGRERAARIEAQLAAMERNWDDTALDARAARALDARQPTIGSQDNIYDRRTHQVAARHYRAMETAGTGGDRSDNGRVQMGTAYEAQPVAPLDAQQPVDLAVAPQARTINVEQALAAAP